MRLFGLLAFVLGLSALARAEQRPIDWIVVVVDADIVTYTEILEGVRLGAARTGYTMDNMPSDKRVLLAEEVTDKLITESIMLQEARRQGISVLPAEIDAETERAIDRVRSQFADQNAYDRALASEFMTPARLREQYKAQAEATLLRQKLIEQEVRRRVHVTDSDVEDAYRQRGEEIHVRHILVADSATASQVLARLERGEDFNRVGQSVDAIEAADLGWVRRGALVKNFEDAAFALTPGNHFVLVKTRYGYHVIQVLEKRTSELPPLTDELRETIYNEIFNMRFEEAFEAYLERVRQRAHVEYRESLSDLFQ